MVEIDHICLGAQNVYEAADRLYRETGLGNYEGGWFPKLGLANRIVPLGGDVYIEVESVIDAYKIKDENPTAVWFDSQVQHGDVFIGWCARVDTRQELERIVKRLGTNIFDSILRVGPNESEVVDADPAYRTPDTISCWQRGLPNFFCVEERGGHPSRLPTSRRSKFDPSGIAWMELGGSEEEMNDWLGVKSSELGLRFNRQAPGVHAVAVGRGSDQIVIRRPPVVA